MSSRQSDASRSSSSAPVQGGNRNRRMPRLIWALSGLNLIVILVVLGLVFVVSERWWVGTIVTYLPRAPWLVPSVLLAVAGLVWHRPSLWASTCAGLLVAGPLMEFRAPWLMETPKISIQPSAKPLRVVSANVQGYKPDVVAMLTEITDHQPDIVLLQEARGEHELLKKFFPDWHHVHADYFWIGSRYPVTLKQTGQTVPFDRVAGLIAEVATPDGPLAVANIHLMTARRGLKEMSPGELVSGAAQADLDEFQMLRMAESNEIREQVRQFSGQTPLLVAGDFNTPASSSLFQSTWGDLTSAFDVAGTGYGYTSPVKVHKFWIPYLPWARIDHILVSPGSQVRSCQVGSGRGSDHHLIAAEVIPARAAAVK